MRKYSIFAPILAALLIFTSAPLSATSSSTTSGELIYFVMIDRFANGNPANDDGGLGKDARISGLNKSDHGFYHGGDIAGLKAKIPYIKSLGFTAIWVTPIVRQLAVSPDGQSSAYHGYWGAGFDEVDPHLGSLAEFKEFVNAAHDAGMKVILDIVTNHTADAISYANGNSYVSIGERPYRDASGKKLNLKSLTRLDKSPKLSATKSFAKTPFVYPANRAIKSPAWLNDVTNYHNRGDSSFAGESSEHGDFFGLDDLFTEKPEVVSGFIDVYAKWITDSGVDGFRIDTVKHVNVEFWQKFLPAMRAAAQRSGKSDFPMWAEVFDAEPTATSYWVRSGGFTEVLDFPFQQRALNFIKDRTALPLATLFNSDDFYLRKGTDVNRLGTFLGNHDMGRVGAFIGLDRGPEIALKQSELAHALLYTLRGTPIVYYGDELGLTGGNDKDARQDLFPTAVSHWKTEKRIGGSPIGDGDSFATTNPLQETLRALAQLRSRYPALVIGGQKILSAGSGVLAISRGAAGSEEVLIAFNTNDEAASATFQVETTNWQRVAGAGELKVSASEATVTLPALSWTAFRSSSPVEAKVESISIARLRIDPLDNSRYEIAARVTGTGYPELVFSYRDKTGEWVELGSDKSPTFARLPVDSGLYRVFATKAALNFGKTLEVRVIAKSGSLDLASATRSLTPKK